MQPSTDAVIETLGDELLPLTDETSCTRVADALGLGEAASDEPVVVGLGEASHGTREFFTWKCRLIRSLVRERGVRLVAIEADYAATLAVDDYVTHGETAASAVTSADADEVVADDASEALADDAIHDVYQVDAVRELVEWLRSFNEGRAPAEMVRFHGIDLQAPGPAARRLATYVGRVAPERVDSVRESVDRLDGAGMPDPENEDAIRAQLDARRAVVSTLGDALDAKEDRLVASTSRPAYESAHRLAWQLERGAALFETFVGDEPPGGENIRIRDEGMAAQVEWLADWTDADRAAVWGHNAHVARHGLGHSSQLPSLGSTLADGDCHYVAVGLTLGGGSVRSAFIPEREFRDYEIGAPPDGSVPDVFSRVDPAVFFVALNDLTDSPLTAWLDTQPTHYTIPGGYEDSPVQTVAYDLREAFDGILFVRETTPARGLTLE